MTERLEKAVEAYVIMFPGAPLHQPWGISDDVLAQAYEKAVASGQPIPDDGNWWAGLPPDAVA